MLTDNFLTQYLEKTVLKGPNWTFKALGVITFFAVCINFGFDLHRWAHVKNFVVIIRGGQGNPQLCCYYWSDIAYQTTDILMQRLQVWDTVHQANMRFRPVLPVLWLVFHSVFAIYVLQVILGIGQLYMVVRTVYAITQDRLQAFYFTVGFAGLYAGAAFYLDFYGFGDAFAYIFMTAAIYFRKPLLIFLSVFLAILVDERALLNASFVILFHLVIANQYDWKTLTIKLLRLPAQAWAVVLSGVIYMVIRLYLTINFQLKTPFGGPSLFFYVREASKTFGIRLWSGFESFWILIVIMLFLLYYERKYTLFSLILFFTFITTITTLMQPDYTIKDAYVFAVFFIAMVIVKQVFSQEGLRNALLFISLISAIFFPVLY